jgi:UDP-3-O-[3-hydroxymyristoyl] glucosamine N-acyltransferase
VSPRHAALRLRRRLVLHGRATIGRGVRIAVEPGARVVLEDGAVLGERCRIEAGGTVHIGARARLGDRTVVVAREHVDVGAGCVVGDWALIADCEVGFPTPSQPVTIGDGARIGAHAAVMRSVAAGAVVEPYAVLTDPHRSA